MLRLRLGFNECQGERGDTAEFVFIFKYFKMLTRLINSTIKAPQDSRRLMSSVIMWGDEFLRPIDWDGHHEKHRSHLW